MSFWNLSDGGTAHDTGTEFELPSGNLEPIPNDSSVLAMVEEAKWTEKGNDYGDSARLIELRWSVVAPEQYANKKVFHKLWVADHDTNVKDSSKAAKKRDKALRMLSAIDANSGGGLPKSEMPTDEQLALHLIGKPMIIKCMVWELEDRERVGEYIRGNWIAAVAPAAKGVSVKEPQKPKNQPPISQALSGDDIPF